MKPSGTDTLAAIRAFLEADILPGVAPEHRSELRAALKLLHTAEHELGELHHVLDAETRELRQLCRAAADQVGTEPPAFEAINPAATLTELQRLHDQARAAAGEALLALQRRARDGDPLQRADAQALLHDFYGALGRHARRRLPWQSVFPAVPTKQGAI
jgi:hypothetical protein